MRRRNDIVPQIADMRGASDPANVTKPEPPPATKAEVSKQPALPNVPMEDRSSMKAPEAPPLPGGFKPPRMPAPYERIVTTVFDMPAPHDEFVRLRQELELQSVKASQASYGIVVDALDRAELNAQQAVELVVNFELVTAAFEQDTLAISGPLRERAREQLEKEKREEYEKLKAEIGSKAPTGKQITDGDVKAAVASMFPDEARILAQREAEGKGALDAAKSLAARWAERARDLRAMVSTVRGGGPH